MHRGKIVTERKGKYKVIDCQICGFKHLDPIPTEEEIKEFYRKKYYSEARRRGKCKEAKLISEGQKRETELSWLRETAYKDRLYWFELYTKTIPKPKCILDVGCGTGDFLKYMEEAGWIGFGMEPSEEAFNKAKLLGLKNVYNTTLEEFAKKILILEDIFDAINLMDILHHVPNPKEILEICKNFLKPGGIMCVEDPNEFNPLQLRGQRVLNKEMWWIVPLEHINYFNFQTLEDLLVDVGFKSTLRTTDFPMELFLLMREDYIGNEGVGSKCHQKRMDFEMALPDNLRRKIYQNLASLGMGRSCIVYAKVNRVQRRGMKSDYREVNKNKGY